MNIKASTTKLMAKSAPLKNMNQTNNDFLGDLEKKFEVTYPVLESATYKSLVNYASDLNNPIQRWYRYKEGYSVRLMQKLFEEYGVKAGDLILDPFSGSGSTLLQAKIDKLEGYGFEINPFSAFLGRVKTQNYSNKDLAGFANNFDHVIAAGKNKKPVLLPKLSIIEKLFNKDVLNFLLQTKSYIESIKEKKVKDLYMLAWLSVLEEVSHHRKAGNGLKIRKEIKSIPRDLVFAKKIFIQKLDQIKEDLPYAINISKGVKEPKIYEQSALDLKEKIKKETIKAVIFSPPYANCFDYTEIYKVELWMGGFVSEYSDLSVLRQKGIRSHLNGYLRNQKVNQSSLINLEKLIGELSKKDLWDPRIPNMVSSYFEEMFSVLKQIYDGLKKGGSCGIIVSNSAYGGLVIPTDLFFAEYAEKIGFKVMKIEVARFIITSSQQYKQTEKNKKYLRESIVHLQKI